METRRNYIKIKIIYIMATYDRYTKFRTNGSIRFVPFIAIPEKNTDYYEIYNLGYTRLDLLSYQYYGNPDYGWLILQANPQFGSMEFEIPDKTNLRIPYPLSTTIEQYNRDIDIYTETYGLD
jgi:hypothetical protein